MSTDSWYYAAGGQQAGPVSTAQLQQLIAQRQVSPKDLVWREGMADWVAAGSVPELAVPQSPYGVGASAPAPGYAPPGYAPQGYAQPGYPQQPVYGQAPQQPPYGQAPLNYGGYQAPQKPGEFASKASTAFTLAIVGIFCFGIILGIIAIVMGSSALSGMNRTGDDRNKGLAIAAIIIGALEVVLTLIYLVVVLGNA